MNKSSAKYKDNEIIFGGESFFVDLGIIGGRIRDERKMKKGEGISHFGKHRKKETQEELADAVFTHRNKISACETGKALLCHEIGSHDLYSDIAYHYGVRVEYLLGLDDYRTVQDYELARVRKQFNTEKRDFERFISGLGKMGFITERADITCGTVIYIDRVKEPIIRDECLYFVKTNDQEYCVSETDLKDLWIMLSDSISNYLLLKSVKSD